MQAKFKKIRPFVYQFDLVDIPFALTDILTEVNYHYLQWPTANLKGGKRHSLKRSNVNDSQPILRDLCEFFCSEEFQSQLVDTIDQDKMFYEHYWKTDKIKFRNGLESMFIGCLDTPGVSIDPHLDNRELVIAGMCHFIDGDDPLQSTVFYTNENCDNPIRMHTGFGVGWVCANLHHTWHSAQNASDKNRFSIKFGCRR